MAAVSRNSLRRRSLISRNQTFKLCKWAETQSDRSLRLRPVSHMREKQPFNKSSASFQFQLVLCNDPKVMIHRMLMGWIVSMRSITFLVFGFCLLPACVPVSQDTPGEVYFRGDEVIIVGSVEHGKTAYPTNRMIEQAKEACFNAYFVNARPSLNKPGSFDFLFDC